MTNNNNPLAQFTVPPSKRTLIAALNRVPIVSPIVLFLLIASTGGVIIVDSLAVWGNLSLGWACAINCFLMYWQFTVVHDSLHRSAAKNQKLNDLFGHIGIATFAPHINLGIFRWAHIQHHRFTNSSKDPDTWMHGKWWTLPLRWVLLDVGYLRFVLRSGDRTAMRHLRGALRNSVITLAIVAPLIYMDYGMHILFLWLIPSRVTFLLVGFVFFWLPHVKDDVTSEEDVTLATSIRLGYEWLLTPICQFHNYHLIHHLFPTMPSYQHLKAWQVLEPELMQRNLQIQHGLAVQPTIHLGN